MADFVRSLGLVVQHFNQDVVVGDSTTERLKELLDISAFAILVMTSEDVHKGTNGKSTMHARENVVHEIGLFQGRLGFRRAIVLKEAGTAVFSNIHGLGHIEFPKGGFRNSGKAQKDLRKVLERERLLPRAAVGEIKQSAKRILQR